MRPRLAVWLATLGMLTGSFALSAVNAPAALADVASFTTAGCAVFTLPAGVTQIDVVAIGAAGQNSEGQGGRGDGVGGRLSNLPPGQQVDVCVAVGGGAGTVSNTTLERGGAGGGASGVALGSDFSNPAIVAGGGGGATAGANGGNAGAMTGAPGGDGVGGLGGNQAGGAKGGTGGNNVTGAAGTGGARAGQGGVGSNGSASSASGPGGGGAGGARDTTDPEGGNGGGGGGAGYFGGGGGGGGPALFSGAGGGGSDFCAAQVIGCTVAAGAGADTDPSTRATAPKVVLTYTVPPTALAITNAVLPSTDPGRFNLQVDGSTAASGTNVGDGGTTGAVVVAPGVHTVGETAMPGTDLANYDVTISCNTPTPTTTNNPGPLTVDVANGTMVTCAITNTRRGATALVVATSSLPAGTIGTPYSTTLAAAGGASPYAWSLGPGSLPEGLALDPVTGIISGTPIKLTGTFSFTVHVTDASKPTQVASRTLFISIGGPGAVTITAESLPNGALGVPYSTALAATGGSPPYAWALVAGSLPANVFLDAASGTISGTPKTAGTFSLTVAVTDSRGQSNSKPLVLTVTGDTPVTITTASLPAAQAQVPYSANISVAGGTAPYHFAITSGVLPPGLAIDSNGLISGLVSGMAKSGGTYPFTVGLTDSSATTQTTSRALSITVIPAAPLTITTGSLPAATRNSPYSATVTAVGGTPPYQWSLLSGVLPPGLSLDSSSGVISGTPIKYAGTFSFTIGVTDAGAPAQTTGQAFSITVG